jgi:hypothetical protein
MPSMMSMLVHDDGRRKIARLCARSYFEVDATQLKKDSCNNLKSNPRLGVRVGGACVSQFGFVPATPVRPARNLSQRIFYFVADSSCVGTVWYSRYTLLPYTLLDTTWNSGSQFTND